MRSGGKYKSAIKDGRKFVVAIFADDKTIFNFNFIRESYHFLFEKERISMGITLFKMNQC